MSDSKIDVSNFLCVYLFMDDTVYVPNDFVIGQIVLKLLIKRLAVAMLNKTVGLSW
jgi:hypothetical protein